MRLNPQVIGKEIPHGLTGCYVRQSNMIIGTHPAGDGAPTPFGTSLEYGGAGVVPTGAAATTAQFVSAAGAEVKSVLTHLDQGQGQYVPGEPVSVFQRGAINVRYQRGIPVLSGAVYVRTTANSSSPTAAVGGFEVEDDNGEMVQLTNCQWAGPVNANGVTGLRILTMNSA